VHPRGDGLIELLRTERSSDTALGQE
jgi:hypothetical protein